ncbi:MAG: hexitol phosphatase HxpB [Deferribacteres bacterium]|nr:hexitol phosphatase HxpB [candidate division KSB1 bacterium]MCB9500543.1 hexitol phosphatase HxpB [Deferribacteres bacterium]
MIKAIIFDVDGLLINSEPLWREAEQLVFGEVGIPLTDEMCAQTMGLRSDEVVDYWYQRGPWNAPEPVVVERFLLEKVKSLVLEKGNALPGVDYILDFFKKRNYTIGLASSSPMMLIEAVIEKLQIAGYFSAFASAENEERGKPDPAVYLTAARNLGVAPELCLAFEDSGNGLMSAKTAGMKTVVVPEKLVAHEDVFELADIRLDSLADFNERHLERLSAF